MKIKQGRFYRYRDTSTIWLVLSLDEATQMTEIAVVQYGNTVSAMTLRHKVATLLDWFTAECSPTWMDVDNDGECHHWEPGCAAEENAEYIAPSDRAAETTPTAPLSWLEQLAQGGNG